MRTIDLKNDYLSSVEVVEGLPFAQFNFRFSTSCQACNLFYVRNTMTFGGPFWWHHSELQRRE